MNVLKTLSVLAGLSVAASAMGQTAPAGQPPLGDPLGLGQPTQPQPPARPAGGSMGTPFWNQNQSDLPAADIRAVAPARMQATAARWAYKNAQLQLSGTLRDMRIALEESDNWRNAVAAEEEAYRALKTARESALAGFVNNADYQANEKLAHRLTLQLEEAHAAPREYRDQARIDALARVKVQTLSSNRELERDALARDEAYQSALKRYVEAGQKLASMRREFSTMVRNDDTLREIRNQIAELRIARLATQAYLESTVRARNIAVNYSAWYRSHDRYISPGYVPYTNYRGYRGFYWSGGVYPIGHSGN